MKREPSYRIVLAILIGVFIALVLAGCQHRILLVDDNALAANITQPCPPLNKLSAGDGKAILKWGASTVNMYEDCRARHSALVEAFKPKE